MTITRAGLAEVQAVYAGPEGRLWELIMGEQIHIGGLTSSTDLARRAGITSGMRGIDLCCCTGAGMRFLLRFCGVANMKGVDATAAMVRLGEERCRREGVLRKVQFILGDACDSGLPDGCVDFAWGEDAWCYVIDKPRLVAEAARLVRRGGTVAFTDWVEGPAGLTPDELDRLLTFMKFPNLQSIAGYRQLLSAAGAEVIVAEDTGRFAPYADLYLQMLNQQLTYDALRIIGWDMALLETMGREMQFLRDLAHVGKIAQGIFVARVG